MAWTKIEAAPRRNPGCPPLKNLGRNLTPPPRHAENRSAGLQPAYPVLCSSKRADFRPRPRPAASRRSGGGVKLRPKICRCRKNCSPTCQPHGTMNFIQLNRLWLVCFIKRFHEHVRHIRQGRRRVRKEGKHAAQTGAAE